MEELNDRIFFEAKSEGQGDVLDQVMIVWRDDPVVRAIVKGGISSSGEFYPVGEGDPGTADVVIFLTEPVTEMNGHAIGHRLLSTAEAKLGVPATEFWRVEPFNSKERWPELDDPEDY